MEHAESGKGDDRGRLYWAGVQATVSCTEALRESPTHDVTSERTQDDKSLVGVIAAHVIKGSGNKPEEGDLD